MKKIFLISIAEKTTDCYEWIRPDLAKFVEIVEDPTVADAVFVIKYNRVTTQDRGQVLLDFLKLVRQLYPDKLLVAHQLNGGVERQKHLAMRSMGVLVYNPDKCCWSGTDDAERISWLVTSTSEELSEVMD